MTEKIIAPAQSTTVQEFVVHLEAKCPNGGDSKVVSAMMSREQLQSEDLRKVMINMLARHLLAATQEDIILDA